MPATESLDLEELVFEYGPLDRTYGLFVPSTINTGAQISADRITDEGLRNIWFYTANVGLATKRDGKLLLGIGGNAAFNAVFGYDTESTCQELRNSGYVHLNEKQRGIISMLEKSGEVVFVDPQDLGLKGNGDEYISFPIRTNKYGKDVTIARTPFVSAGYGSGDMLKKVMENLKTNGKISETRVYTINPEHAAQNLKDNEIVACAGGLGGFGYDSKFGAFGQVIVLPDSALRGVRRRIAEGAAQNDYATHLNAILKNPLPDERVAAALLGKVNEHYNPKRA